LERAQCEPEECERSSSKSKDQSSHTGPISRRGDEGLTNIAFVFRHEIPPAVGQPVSNKFGSGACPRHPGERGVRDGGLAHRVVGRLGFSHGNIGAGERDKKGSAHVGGQGVIDALCTASGLVSFEYVLLFHDIVMTN
jgi:hypothetical protein